jgi:hypothetical protein|tara:strand:- start:258 stop:923 length:666 start_codon:yes stop_codon:yes gene_type:complete
MSNYFNYLPDFEYVSRLPDAKISDYIRVKNLFKKGVIRDDIFQDITFFTKYQIQGDDRPDNVASKVYNDSKLDWIVLQSNNIVNLQTEWPLSQNDFDRYCLEKYGDYNTLYNGVHHYETIELKNSSGVVILPAGKTVPSDFSISFYDDQLEQVISASETTTVTNYEYEDNIQTNKRNIFLLKQEYIPVVIDDVEDIMSYRKGSTQYMSRTLKRADNIRLYE